MFIKFEFPYALFPKPRGKQSGKGKHIYHNSTEYLEFKSKIISQFRSNLSTYSLPKQFLLGFFNGYYKNPRGRQPDLDNLEGGILDALIASGLLVDDNRECCIGGYKKAKNIAREESLIIVCTEDQEDRMIADIRERYKVAQRKVLQVKG